MQKLLQLLQDGEFHSGESLGRAIGLSRAGVWKRLQGLEAELGITIFRVRGRGYRLSSPLSLLRTDELGEGLAPYGWKAVLTESVSSTNAEALRLLSTGASGPLLVVAEKQSSGRGRRGRVWVSPYGANLYYSLGLQLDGGVYPLEGLSLTIGLAVRRALVEFGCETVGLKWPNDLLLDGRKIAGILIELAGDPSSICQVVIGIGINVNMTGAIADIDQPWASLQGHTGRLVDRTALALRLSHWLQRYLELHRENGFSGLRQEWEACHLWQGAEASLLAGPQRIDGVVLGVDQQGALRMQVAGEERHFSGGELSLRLRDDS